MPRKQSGGDQVERSPNAMNARSPMVLQTGQSNPADGLTKVKHNGRLECLLRSDKLLIEAAVWIDRPDTRAQTNADEEYVSLSDNGGLARTSDSKSASQFHA
jgi:hypothetical protein